ncbi:MAG TPA: DUF424 domain-containing protein [Candidatus Norongarragalinales archaeon]|nr:DUF424 domain-containing protein [Candidatus Norongarragalinales archaeon]
MIGKWHEKRNRLGRVWTVFALCDKNLLGRVLRQGESVLDLSLHRSFYEGDPMSEKVAEQCLKKARNINVVGEKSLGCARRVFKIENSSVKKIENVPHLQIYYV